MREFPIRFCSSQDVLDVVSLATAQPFPIQVGNDSYCVSGTSFMGMFSLDYTRPVKVMVRCGEAEFQQFLREADRFLVK